MNEPVVVAFDDAVVSGILFATKLLTVFNGLAGRTGGAVVEPLADIAGEGPALVDEIFTKFSGNSPRFPFNSPRHQPSSVHLRFITVTISPSRKSSSSGLIALYS